jgi:hypothetical protein
MYESDGNVKLRANINAMATTGHDNVRRNPRAGHKTAGNNVFGTKRQYQLQADLGRNLKAVYQDLVREPVPDRLIKLLGG